MITRIKFNDTSESVGILFIYYMVLGEHITFNILLMWFSPLQAVIYNNRYIFLDFDLQMSK